MMSSEDMSFPVEFCVGLSAAAPGSHITTGDSASNGAIRQEVRGNSGLATDTVMDFLNKPVSEMWKATKRTLAEIIDSNEEVRTPGASHQVSGYQQERLGDVHVPGTSSQTSAMIERKSRTSLGPHVKGRHGSRENNLDRDYLQGERENRPMDCNVVPSPGATYNGRMRSASTDCLDAADIQTTSGLDAHSMPKIKGKEKAIPEKDRTRNAWTKLRLGNFIKSFPSNEIECADGNTADPSAILPSRINKTSPTYASNSSVGSPGKAKTASRASRRSRGEIGQKNMDFRSRFRSNSSDRATMKRREREERERSRRSSYSRSTSYSANEEPNEDEDEEVFNGDDISDDQAERVKMKILSMWNNVKYGWTVKTKTNFSIHKAIWFLGKCYHQRPEDPDPERPPGMDSVRSMVLEKFKQDFSSRIWMTYRREFPTLAGSNLTSDCGWGCMLRSGQMLLAHSLILHFLGRDWNLYREQRPEEMYLHRQIIRWFGDQPLDMSPFSVHRLVSIGQTNGKKVGDWYGPASVAHILKEAMDTAPELNPLLGQLCIYVAQDCTVYKQDVIDLCRSRAKERLVPVYSDVPSETSQPSQPIKCTTQGSPGQDRSRRLHHEQLQRCSPSESGPGPAGRTGAGCAVGTRLARSHEKGASVYGAPGQNFRPSERSVSSGSSTSTGISSSWHMVGTSLSGSPGGSSGHRRHCPSGPLSDQGSLEVSQSLPSRPGQHLSDESPRTSLDKSVDTRTGQRLSRDARSTDSTDCPAPSGGVLGNEAMVNGRTHIAQRGTDMQDILNLKYDHDADNDVFGMDEDTDRTSGCDPMNVNRPFQSPPNPLASQSLSRAAPADHISNTSQHSLPDQRGPTTTNSHLHESHTTSSDEAPPTPSPAASTSGPVPEGKKPWCAVIILVPVRLGGDDVNSVYVRPIQSLFTMDSCLGIIGGKPKHSLYFVGFQEEKLVHLDPHYCQQVVDMKCRDFPVWSFHCMSPRKMSIGKMDPSCTVGFYLKTEEDFERFCKEIPKVVSPLGSHATDYPMFIIREGRCSDWQNKNTNTNRPERYLRVRHVDENGRLIAPVKESEDFVLLDA